MARLKDLVEQLEAADKIIADQNTQIESHRATIESYGQDLDKLMGKVAELTTERDTLLSQLAEAQKWERRCKTILRQFGFFPDEHDDTMTDNYVLRLLRRAEKGRVERADRLIEHAREHARVLQQMKQLDYSKIQFDGAKLYAERMEAMRQRWIEEDLPSDTETVHIVTRVIEIAKPLEHVTLAGSTGTQDAAHAVCIHDVTPQPGCPVCSPTMTDLMVSPEAIDRATENVELPPVVIDTTPAETAWEKLLRTLECVACHGSLRAKRPGELVCSKCTMRYVKESDSEMSFTRSASDTEDGC